MSFKRSSEQIVLISRTCIQKGQPAGFKTGTCALNNFPCNIRRPMYIIVYIYTYMEITPPFHRVSFRHATGSTVSSAWITSSSSKALMTWQIPSCRAFKLNADESFLQNQRQQCSKQIPTSSIITMQYYASLQLGFHWLNMRKESIAQSFASVARRGVWAPKAIVP